jgi:pyruvate dehydrogenase E1 component beta subunit
MFLEPQVLSSQSLRELGGDERASVELAPPPAGAAGEVDQPVRPVPLGRAVLRRNGTHLTMVSLGLGVHHALSAAADLARDGLSCDVIDLRSVRPLDTRTVALSVARTGRLLVVDEDYREMGLSGELGAAMLEAGLAPRYARVCCEGNVPFARHLATGVIPDPDRIARAARALCGKTARVTGPQRIAPSTNVRR